MARIVAFVDGFNFYYVTVKSLPFHRYINEAKSPGKTDSEETGGFL